MSLCTKNSAKEDAHDKPSDSLLSMNVRCWAIMGEHPATASAGETGVAALEFDLTSASRSVGSKWGTDQEGLC